MHTAVCVKQVPDTTEVKVNPETGTLIRTGVPSIINPFDHFALEKALRIKEKTGGEVTVISMGPPQARSVIQLALALGADKGILLCDMAFAGSDTWATSYALSKAIKRLGKIDLILCGLQAIDGDTAQVGPGIAQQMRIPQITYCETVEVEGGPATVDADPSGTGPSANQSVPQSGARVESGGASRPSPKAKVRTIRARRLIDDGYEVIEAKPPVLCTMIMPHDFEPEYPSFVSILEAQNKPYEVWTAEDITADPALIGLKGSPTQVDRVYPPPQREKGEILKGSPAELAEKLLSILRQEKFIE